MKPFRMALCQICPNREVDRTVSHAFSMIHESVAHGAMVVSLPELFYQPYELALIKKNGDMGRLLPLFQNTARKNNIYICTGSLAIKSGTGLQNTSFLIGPSGKVLLTYSKCHLFDVALKKVKVRESSVFTPGDYIATVKTPLGSMGVLICYDIRFPEMARCMALCGAEVLVVPAVFNNVTGPAHWRLLHRARAVENQLFVAAVSQARSSSSKFKAYGHSMVVSPWGEVLAEAGAGETIVYADIEPEILDRVRKEMPVFKHRRGDIFGE